MPEVFVISNCKLVGSPPESEPVSILTEDGIIRKIGRGEKLASRGALDAEGRIICPGFIDVHIQGAGGADVLDGTDSSLRTIARTLPRFGTTGFLATTVFKHGCDNPHLAITARNVGRNLGGAHLLGIHLEGPFISMERRGMISPECISEPSTQALDEILGLTKGTLKIMTIAPELPGSLHIIQRLVQSSIIASFGHSNATYEETLKGFEAGISHVTHLFNAMPSLHHRAPGPLLAIFKAGGPSVQIIPDGVHLHPRILKFIFDIITIHRCITISDGMQAMGLPDGTYVYNGKEYESRKGTARYLDGTLIGTTMGLIQLVLLLMEYTDCSLEVAIQTITENPARLLCIDDRKGSIAVGKDADFVILDHDYSVWATIAGGRIVYRKII